MKERQLRSLLNWIDDIGGETFVTLADFSIALGGLPIWPVWGSDDTDLEIFVDDLLSWLTECWKPLLLRQSYPNALKVDPRRRRWSHMRESHTRGSMQGPQ